MPPLLLRYQIIGHRDSLRLAGQGCPAREISALIDAFRTGRAAIVVAEMPDFSWQPLCSVVHNGILTDVRAALEAGQLGVQRLWRRLGAVGVPFADDTPFFNANTPEDMARWREMRNPQGRQTRGSNDERQNQDM